MLNGILLLNKPSGFTSHDAVAKLRGILRQRKIGHAGTLDPMAQGVLVMLLGTATGAERYASSQHKSYNLTLRLGVETDTYDTTGQQTHAHDGDFPTQSAVHATAASFLGVQDQLPPMYSAVSIGGKRLYDLARKGIEVERPARSVEIFSIDPLPKMQGDGQNDYRFSVVCSKGTYIRTLCYDIGRALGVGGCMAELVRTASGDFTLDRAYAFEEIEAARDTGSLQDLILPTDGVFASLPRIVLNEQGVLRAKNGAVIFPQNTVGGKPFENDVKYTVYDEQGEFLMISNGAPLDKGGIGLFCEKTFWSR